MDSSKIGERNWGPVIREDGNPFPGGPEGSEEENKHLKERINRAAQRIPLRKDTNSNSVQEAGNLTGRVSTAPSPPQKKEPLPPDWIVVNPNDNLLFEEDYVIPNNERLVEEGYVIAEKKEDGRELGPGGLVYYSDQMNIS